MDSELSKNQKALCDELENQIESNVPACRASNLGFSIIVFFDNQSMATLYPVTRETVDLFAQDFRDEEYDIKNLSVAKCIELLQELATLTEETSTGAVAPTVEPLRPKRPLKPISETESRFQNSFGEDPLGQKAMNGNPDKKKNSEGQKVSAIRHPYAGNSPLALSENSGSSAIGSLAENEAAEVFTQLAEKLPVDGSEILDEKTLVLTTDCVSIFVTAQDDGNFSTHTEIDGETIQETENVPLGDLTKWLFTVCDGVQNKVAARDRDEAETEVEPNEVYEVLKDLAASSGHSTDILRNKDLFDLKQGLCVSRPPFDREQSPESFVAETSGSQVSASLRGSTMKNGAPVSLNENRDVSRPFSSTLGNKVLVYLPGVGATLVDKSQLPEKKKLNWSPEHGVILTEASEPTRRPSWFFRGWK